MRQSSLDSLLDAQHKAVIDGWAFQAASP